MSLRPRRHLLNKCGLVLFNCVLTTCN